MAEKTAKIEPKKKPERLPGRLRHGLLWFLALLLAAGVLAWLGTLGVGRLLFTRNDRFLLRNFELETSEKGYWRDRPEPLAERLNLRVGRDNLFALDPRQLRRELLRIPSIESCEVHRILPDTLRIRIVERIPRAALYNPNSRWVVDAEGVVMSRFEAMKIAHQLPVITGFSPTEKITAGHRLEPALPALELLMETIRSFPDISVRYINCSKPGKLDFVMRYRNQRNYQVVIPTRVGPRRRMSSLLMKLQSAIIEAQRSDDGRSRIDLSFEGQVILR